MFTRFDGRLKEAGYLALGGQIVDASLVAAPKQRNTEAEKVEIKAGRIPPEWAKHPAKLRQKDRDARWTVKFSKAKPREDGTTQADIAVPAFGYKNHISIDRRHRLIRRWAATDAAAHDGARLGELIDYENTASALWADTSYRSSKERSTVGKTTAGLAHSSQEAARLRHDATHPPSQRLKSAVRASVEHVFAYQKGPMRLVIRTIGLARARVKVGLANPRV